MENLTIDRKKYKTAVRNRDGFLNRYANQIRGALLQDATLNPANLLQATGSNPVQRGRQKVNHTLLWLSVFTRSTQAIVLERLGVEGRGWMRKLERDGLVKPVISNVNSGELWVLTQEGLLASQGVWSKSFDHYPDRPERLSQATLRHDLAVQKIIAGLVATGEVTEFHSASIIGGGPNAWRPDAVVRHRDGHWLGIEYERTPKYGYELQVKANRIVDFLNQQNQVEFVFGVRFYSHHRQCLVDYQKLLKKVDHLEYSDISKRWQPDSYDQDKVKNLSYPEQSVEVVLMDKDLAKYM